MRVGIDLDGVCYDFAASFRRYLHEHEGFPCWWTPQATRWEFYEDWGFTLDEFLNLFNRGVDAGVIFAHGQPYANTQEAFKWIKAAGHTIHIVTDRSMGRPGASEKATRVWLDKYDMPFDSLTFSADKTVVNLDVMVDDKPSNYEALRAAGVDARLLTRPWNQHVPDARRVRDLLHFAEVIA